MPLISWLVGIKKAKDLLYTGRYINGKEAMRIGLINRAVPREHLEEEVKKGLFRKDLFYRIHIIPIYLPPLRERKDDIQPLAEHFVKKFNKQMKMDIKGLTSEAITKLLLHDWPGNVRELENMIEYAMNMTSVNYLTGDHILPLFSSQGPADAEASKSLKEIKENIERSCLINYLQTCKGNVSNAAVLAGKHRTDFYSLLNKHHINAVDFRIRG